jgi:hypothetical protein
MSHKRAIFCTLSKYYALRSTQRDELKDNSSSATHENPASDASMSRKEAPYKQPLQESDPSHNDVRGYKIAGRNEDFTSLLFCEWSSGVLDPN